MDTPTCPHCGGPMETGTATLCGPASGTAMARAIAAGIIDP